MNLATESSAPSAAERREEEDPRQILCGSLFATTFIVIRIIQYLSKFGKFESLNVSSEMHESNMKHYEHEDKTEVFKLAIIQF